MFLNFKHTILSETDDYIIINKPPFISVLEDRVEETDLLTLARDYFPGASACHRLDKETTGVLVFSKNEGAYKHLALQFEKRTVEKTYHAIVEGVPGSKHFELNAPLKVSGVEVFVHPEGKPSLTIAKVLDVYKKHTLLECKISTGRRHQIRVHMASAGHPVVHDTLYGGKPVFLSEVKRNYNLKKWEEEESLSKRVALHALTVRFRGINDEELFFEAPYPKDFRALVRQLEKNR